MKSEKYQEAESFKKIFKNIFKSDLADLIKSAQKSTEKVEGSGLKPIQNFQVITNAIFVTLNQRSKVILIGISDYCIHLILTLQRSWYAIPVSLNLRGPSYLKITSKHNTSMKSTFLAAPVTTSLSIIKP